MTHFWKWEERIRRQMQRLEEAKLYLPLRPVSLKFHWSCSKSLRIILKSLRCTDVSRLSGQMFSLFNGVVSHKCFLPFNLHQYWMLAQILCLVCHNRLNGQCWQFKPRNKRRTTFSFSSHVYFSFKFAFIHSDGEFKL